MFFAGERAFSARSGRKYPQHAFLPLTVPPCRAIIAKLVIQGEMAERLMALVLKTSDAERHRGFESLSLRQFNIWRSTQEAEGAPLLRE